MLLIPCPFCGPRSESEFHFGGDLGNLRPEGHAAVSDGEWSSYLHMRHNKRGPASEVWMHLTCGELFRLDRNTVDHAVDGSTFLDGEHSQ